MATSTWGLVVDGPFISSCVCDLAPLSMSLVHYIFFPFAELDHIKTNKNDLPLKESQIIYIFSNRLLTESPVYPSWGLS